MSVFRLGLEVLEYRPRYVSYVVVGGNLRSKYDYSDLETVGLGTAHFSHKKAFISFFFNCFFTFMMKNQE
mgnify:CR=1 FL=1